PHDRNQDLTELHEWIAAIGPDPGIAPEDVPVGDILDLSRAVAHGVLRPGVPVTGFLAGLAVGRGLSAEHALAVLTQRAQNWRTDRDAQAAQT
ncbi:MAG: DUF6457 domain-containing protein, partial [Propionibacteriaceae bacterium]|nr:DUF6457 domain-containing protein [Propionibacteriaceae bacterium]